MCASESTCARFSNFSSPADACHHTVSGIYFIFFALPWLSPPFSALPSLPPPCFSSPPRGSLRDVCVCPNVWVFTSGIKGVKSRESIKEYKGRRAPDETRPVPQISCSPPSFNFGDILFILFFFPFFLFLDWKGFSSGGYDPADSIR